MAYLCGKEGYVQVGATRLDVLQWTASEDGTFDETTNTASNGFVEELGCKRQLTGSFEANYDILLGPKTAPSIDVLDEVALELHTGTGGNYTLTANIKNIRWTNPAGATITWSCDFASTGSYAHTP